jgi:hypothetical protein
VIVPNLKGSGQDLFWREKKTRKKYKKFSPVTKMATGLLKYGTQREEGILIGISLVLFCEIKGFIFKL